MSSFSLSFAASVSAEINDQTHLQQDDERHTDPEFHMSSLVPAKLHSHDGTDAAAKKAALQELFTSVQAPRIS